MSVIFDEVFNALRAIMVPLTDSLDVVCDEPGNYDVNTFYTRENKQRLWFGGVRTKKNYVSYHLMPIYMNPELLKTTSLELKKRMQGKSCFNFKLLDDTLFAELAVLTELGLQDLKAKGLLNNADSL